MFVGPDVSEKQKYIMDYPGYKIVHSENLPHATSQTRQLVNDGHSVIVLRTNLNKRERKFFLNIARVYMVKYKCVVFKFKLDFQTVDEHEEEINRFLFNKYEAPVYEEGFSSIRHLY